MKFAKLLLPLLLVVVTVSASKAQFGFGHRLGFNVSNFYGKNVSTIKGKGGAVIGLVFPYKFNKTFRIQPELLLSQKGARTSSYSYNGYGSRFTMLYLEIPILAIGTFQFGDGATHLYVEIGPSLGYWVRGFNRGVGITNTRYDFNSSVDNRLDVSAVTGLGFLFKVGNGEFFFGPRVYFGTLSFSDYGKAKNFVFSFSGGYTIFFGGGSKES